MGKIPTPLRINVWEIYSNRQYEIICPVCNINNITTHNFHCGHIIPDSWGGPTEISNLIPICKDCNLGMGNRYMIEFQTKNYGIDTITPILQYHNLETRFLEIKQFFLHKFLELEQNKFKKHRCNFIPLNRKVKTCRKMCNYDQEFCTEHQELMNKRITPRNTVEENYFQHIVPMDVD